jgi:hypothetical protein
MLSVRTHPAADHGCIESLMAASVPRASAAPTTKLLREAIRDTVGPTLEARNGIPRKQVIGDVVLRDWAGRRMFGDRSSAITNHRFAREHRRVSEIPDCAPNSPEA